MKYGNYFFSRIEKNHEADWSEITYALENADILPRGKYKFAITDLAKIKELNVYYGKMVKYEDIGIDKTVDEASRKLKTEEVSKKAYAESPFIFSSENAYVCHLHVWNMIREEEFRQIMNEMMRRGAPLAQFNMNIISDEIEFLTHLREFSAIYEIKARIVPPNPLFGPLWEELKEYIKRRRSREIRHKEISEKKSSIQSGLIEAANSTEYKPQHLDFGDKMVFMALDGYGDASVKGLSGKTVKRIRTVDAKESFEFDKDPPALVLAQKTVNEYQEMAVRRKWQH